MENTTQRRDWWNSGPNDSCHSTNSSTFDKQWSQLLNSITTGCWLKVTNCMLRLLMMGTCKHLTLQIQLWLAQKVWMGCGKKAWYRKLGRVVTVYCYSPIPFEFWWQNIYAAQHSFCLMYLCLNVTQYSQYNLYKHWASMAEQLLRAKSSLTKVCNMRVIAFR